MLEVDERGAGPTQKDVPSYFLGFPIRKFQFAIGWTRQYEKYATPADYAVKNSAAQGADWRRTRYELQKAVFNPTNATFYDLHVDNAPVPVKAFTNADGAPIPNGPNGETFDGTSHTHFTGASSLTAAEVTALIQNVAEHRNGCKIRLTINVADVAAFSALTGFQPLLVPYITPGTQANQVVDPRLDISRVDDRMIGWFGSAEVWTKPWAVQNYIIAIDVAAPQKPLVRRVELEDRGLYVAAEIDAHPLLAQYVEHFFGFGAWNRLAVAILQFNNSSYSIPTLTY